MSRGENKLDETLNEAVSFQERAAVKEAVGKEKCLLACCDLGHYSVVTVFSEDELMHTSVRERVYGVPVAKEDLTGLSLKGVIRDDKEFVECKPSDIGINDDLVLEDGNGLSQYSGAKVTMIARFSKKI